MNPLTPNYAYFARNSALRDKVNGVDAELSSGGTWPAGGGLYGQSREHTATADYDHLGPTADLLPLQEITIVLGYKKTDATNRISVAFGSRDHGGAGDTASRCSSHLPYNNGTVYWDFGGDSGSNRVSVGGLTFGDDVWAFTTGPRGQEIWQNAVRQAFAAAQNPTRTDAPYDVVSLGMLPGIASDLAIYRFFYIYHRQLTEYEIDEITADPFSWAEQAFADTALPIDLSEPKGLTLELPLPVDLSEPKSLALDLPLPLDNAPFRLTSDLPVLVDAGGDDLGVMSGIFDVFRPIDSPITGSFDILVGASVGIARTPILGAFDVQDARNGIVGHFEVVPNAVVKARKKTGGIDPNIQSPVAEVEIT